MSTINFLTPGFNKAGQNNIDNQGGIIGPENDPVINDLVTIFTSPGTFNRTATEGTVLVVEILTLVALRGIVLTSTSSSLEAPNLRYT